MSMGGGGGGGAPANQNITTSNIAEWARPGVESLIQSGMKTVYPGMTPVYTTDEQGNKVLSSYNLGEAKGYTPFNVTSTDPAMQQAMQAAQGSIAGFSPLQQQVFGEAAGLQTPGQFGTATGLAGQAAQGGLGSTGAAYGYGGMGAGLGLQAAGLAPQAQNYGATGAGIGAQGLGYGAAGAQAGMGYGQQATNPAAVQAYMNPYLQGSLQPQLNEIQRQADLAAQAAASQATGAGAFGGTRGQLAQMEAQRAGQLAKQQAIGQGYNQAFQNAQQQMQTAAQLGMQGAGVGLQGLQTGMAGQQLGLAGLGQAGQLYGQGMQGAQVGLQGVQGAQAGYGLANQAAQNLSNIGAQQQASDLARLQAQAGFGATQQQQQQNILNQAMQNYQTMQGYPMQQLAKLESLYTGAPQNITQTGYQAAPSGLSQVAGLGTAGLAAAKLYGMKKGGKVGDGLDTLSLYNAMKGKS